MRLLRLFLAALLLAAAQPGAARADDRIVRLTSLDWPPFTGEHGDALLLDLVRKALARRGYALEVTVLPWKRAVDAAVSEPQYLGVAGVYVDDLQNLAGFFASAPVMTSPLALAERAEGPIHWDALADLAPYKIGTVLGYTNTREFDEAVAAGKLTAEPAPTDAVNLRRLAAGRIDAAIVDAKTFGYLLAHDEVLAPAHASLRLNAHVLASKGICVAFRESAAGHAMAAELAEGLKLVNAAEPPVQ